MFPLTSHHKTELLNSVIVLVYNGLTLSAGGNKGGTTRRGKQKQHGLYICVVIRMGKHIIITFTRKS